MAELPTRHSDKKKDGNRVNRKKIEEKSVEKESKKGEQKEKIFQYITAVVAVIGLIVSVVGILISISSLRISRQTRDIQEAEYKYKLRPEIKILTDTTMRTVIENGVEKRMPLFSRFHVDIVEENNLDRIYIVDPDFQVEEIDRNNVAASMETYFSESIGDGAHPDIADTVHRWYYYYRFIVLKALDGTTDVRAYYFKTQPLDLVTKSAQFGFSVLDDITIIEFEKSHLDDPVYAGERQIAAQYWEVVNYIHQ